MFLSQGPLSACGRFFLFRRVADLFVAANYGALFFFYLQKLLDRIVLIFGKIVKVLSHGMFYIYHEIENNFI